MTTAEAIAKREAAASECLDSLYDVLVRGHLDEHAAQMVVDDVEPELRDALRLAFPTRRKLAPRKAVHK